MPNIIMRLFQIKVYISILTDFKSLIRCQLLIKMFPQYPAASWSRISKWVDLFKKILNEDESPFNSFQSSSTKEGFYEKAKEQETKFRNLPKALEFYAKAAINQEKVNSCIKDFAAVLHQCGFTKEAIVFLKEMKPIYKGDMKKFDRLLQNFEIQINPTGKHQYVKLLLDFRQFSKQVNNHAHLIMNKMFKNSFRIKNIERFQCLSLQNCSMDVGRYFLLTFETFSAAKKTLESFDEENWFGIDKYWVNIENRIVAEALDSKTDFERGLKINGNIFQQKYLEISCPLLYHIAHDELQLSNLTAMVSIQDHFYFKYKHSISEEEYERENEQDPNCQTNNFNW